MKRHAHLLVVAAGLCFGCSKSENVTPGEFTREYAKSLRQAGPGLKVAIVRDLELRVTTADGHDTTSFLDNAYDTYKQDPRARAEVIQRYVGACLEWNGGAPNRVERARIIPVIKDRPWLKETRQALLSRGAQQTPELIFEDFSPDLVIVYAEDSPKSIRYLRPADLIEARIERRELRALACENLKRLLPKIECHGSNGLYIVTAGGNYEASLLLLDSMWNGGQIKVQGDIVAAIPTRDLLLVTGSAYAQGMENIKEMAKKAASEGSYRLTPKLFVYGGGKFSEYRENAESSRAASDSSR